MIKKCTGVNMKMKNDSEHFAYVPNKYIKLLYLLIYNTRNLTLNSSRKYGRVVLYMGY